MFLNVQSHTTFSSSQFTAKKRCFFSIRHKRCYRLIVWHCSSDVYICSTTDWLLAHKSSQCHSWNPLVLGVQLSTRLLCNSGKNSSSESPCAVNRVWWTSSLCWQRPLFETGGPQIISGQCAKKAGGLGINILLWSLWLGYGEQVAWGYWSESVLFGHGQLF